MTIAAQTAATALISSLIGALVAAIVSRTRTSVEENTTTARAMQEGMRCLMRESIMHTHSAATSRGFITYNEHQHIKQVYDAYHALGGNGSATELLHDIDRLPIKDQP